MCERAQVKYSYEVSTLEDKLSYEQRTRNLSFAISYYRKKNGYSQERLAEKVGVSRQHLASVEAPNMNRGLSLELLFGIAAALDIEPYLLLKFNPEA